MKDLIQRYFQSNDAKIISFGILPKMPLQYKSPIISVWRYANARALNIGRFQVSVRWPWFKAYKLIDGKWSLP